MAMVNIVKDFNVVPPTTRPTAPVLGVNADRKFLQVINNATTGTVRAKFDQNFLVPANEIQVISFSGTPNSGTWTIKDWTGAATSSLTATASANDVQTALQALTAIGSGNCTVTGSMSAGFTVTFNGSLAQTPMPGLMSVVSSLEDTTNQATCVQLISWSAAPTAGTFKLQGSAGNKTTALNWNDNGTTIAAALNALPEINGGVASVTVGASTITVTFGSPLANQPVALLLVTDNTLTNNSTLVNAVQEYIVEPQPQQGTYQIGFETYNTVPLAYNANAATIKSALEALPSIGIGNVDVVGINLQSGFVLSFKGALGNQALPLIAIVDGGLHADVLQEPQKRFGDVIIQVSQPTPGVGPVAVTSAVTFSIPGVSPLSLTGSVALSQAGQAQVVDGTAIPSGTNMTLDHNVPIGSLFLISDTANVQVTVLEGI